jgi:hypothetical protein
MASIALRTAKSSRALMLIELCVIARRAGRPEWLPTQSTTRLCTSSATEWATLEGSQPVARLDSSTETVHETGLDLHGSSSFCDQRLASQCWKGRSYRRPNSTNAPRPTKLSSPMILKGSAGW